MKRQYLDNLIDGLRGVWPLYGAAFAMAINLSVVWTAMPFVIRDMGGTEEHVGYVWAANMGGYVICLLLAATRFGHLNARRTTRAAAAVMLLSTTAMALVVYRAIACEQVGRVDLIWTVIAAGTLSGAAMSMYWPFLMTWVSADYEGDLLNRRLGTYNGSWSAAAVMGPLIGGALVDMSTLGPLVVGVGGLAMCVVLLCVAHDRSAGSAVQAKAPATPEVYLNQAGLRRFKWMARIALFCSWACLGVSRSQFALLFTGLGFTETQFGVVITIFGICNFLVLTGVSRVAFWHFKPAFLLGVQVVLAIAVLLMIFGRTLWAFVPGFIIMGSAFGFAYSSHQYYGASGSPKRSMQMAIHEATLSFGVIAGSGGGGYLAGNVGLYAPYWFAIAVLIAGLAAQIAVWFALKPAVR